jgi:enediyne biosynthesis protein E4
VTHGTTPRHRAVLLVALGITLVACSSPEEPAASPGTSTTVAPRDDVSAAATEAMPVTGVMADESPVTFTDIAEAAGLRHEHQGELRLPPDCLFGHDPGAAAAGCTSERMSGGVAVGDFDGDGLADLYFTRLDQGGVLYRNLGDGTFAEVTEAAGVAIEAHTNGAGFADLDNDGWLDLVVTTIADDRYHLFMNNGDGTFAEKGVERGVALADDRLRGGQSVTFGDVDNDGWLDIHLTEWLDASLQSDEPSAHARLLRNRGTERPGYFEDVTEAAGVVLGTSRIDSIGTVDVGKVPNYSFGSALVDLDGDGWPDLLVAADYGTTQLFWNEGDGTFTEGTLPAGIGTEGNAMGLAIGDVDGDGLLDVFITAIYGRGTDCTGRPCEPGLTGNRLYLNNGDRTFSEEQGSAGVTDGAWGWGAAIVDLDNDGLLDIVMANGVDLGIGPEHEQIYRTYLSTPSRAWRNRGDGTFADVAAAAGLDALEPTIGLAVLDLGLTGGQDLVMVRNSGPPMLWRNSGTDHGWLRIEAEGRDSNRDGIGAVVEVTARAGDSPQVRHIGIGTHFLGQSERAAHVGLGAGDAPVVEVRVRWPSTGRESVHTDVPRGSTLRVIEPER